MAAEENSQEQENIPYPPVGFHFEVVFDGVDGSNELIDARFQEVSGFGVELTTEEIDEGGENRFIHRVPKKTKYSNLVLKRGLMTDSGLVTWITDAIENYIFKPALVTVNLLDEEHNTLVSWDFARAYPVKWSTSDLKAQDNSIVVETLELSYQFFTKSYH
ncbi:MAG: phage tail protein [Bacteroidia bacterium]